MALDAATLALLAGELKTALPEARIDKIHQPTRDEVLLHLRSRTASFRLLLSARLGSARVCLTNESYENPAAPPSFCMLLRKYLTGGRVVDIYPLPGDRIVFFEFLCTNELGDLVTNTLAAELMGRYCNLVLLRGAPLKSEETGGREPTPLKIIDALKRVDFEDSEVRQLLPGLPYTLPPRPNRPDAVRAPVEDIMAAILQKDLPAPDAVRTVLGGVGPVIAREVCHRAGLAGAAALCAARLDALRAALCDVQADWLAGGHPNMVLGPEGLPTEFSFTPLTQYQPGGTLRPYEGFCALLEGYYAEKDRVERLRQKSKELRRTVQNMYDRAVRKQAARREEMAAGEKCDSLREMGELLTANLHAFQKGDTSVRLQNWADGTEVDIALDARLSPSQNAQKYFKTYKKRQTAARMLAQLTQAGEREMEYLATVLYEVDGAEGEAALLEIRAELKAQGYLKYYKPRPGRQKPAGPWRYTSSDGFTVLAGRNNLQNERLTLKTARGKDLWFHTKNAPGSHVVVMSAGRDIPLPTQNEAAMLAVWHSSQKGGAKVPVDYTQVKNIRKTGDLPPGMVLYEHYETAYVTPSPEALKRLGPGSGSPGGPA